MGHSTRSKHSTHRSDHPIRLSSIRKYSTVSRTMTDLPISSIFTWSILVLAILVAHSKAQEDVVALCRSESSSQSCSRCIQKNSQCAWCIDPSFTADFRCDTIKNFDETCSPQYLYQEQSHVRITENVPAGTFEPQHAKIRQIEPQQVHVLVRPGEPVTFPLKFYHSEASPLDVHILNSATEQDGVTLSYSVDCKGVHTRLPTCHQVENAQTIYFNVSVSIRDCSSNSVASIGIGGVREVVALYVRPQCGCDCERPDKQEARSGHCGGEGTLTCGVCHCDDPTKGGRHCECDLRNGMTSSDMEGQCREGGGKAMCSGHGYCACGTCVCEPPHLYSGQYCECGKVECPQINGHQCNGRGSCSCGKCQCESGWSGPNCECSPQKNACFSDDGALCSGHGNCACNKCNCDGGYYGDRCEHLLEPAPTIGTESVDESETPGNEEASSEAHSEAPEAPEATSGTHEVPKAEHAAEASTAATRYSCSRFIVFVLSVACFRSAFNL